MTKDLNCTEISCKTAANAVKGRFPYRWDINAYRGCGHACVYCFALYTHSYLNSGAFFSDIYVKTNIAEQLEKQLSAPNWKKEVVNLGGVTDHYQPAEERYRIMPKILNVLIRHRNPCIICTKSDLILRDYDLIDELSRLTYVNIASTVTCAEEDTRRKIEPGSVSTARRLAMLRQFKSTKASVGVHFMPAIPLLTDTRENAEAIFSEAADLGADYIIPGLLNLRGLTRKFFFAFIENNYPRLYSDLCALYRNGSLDHSYRPQFYKLIQDLCKKYRISLDYLRPMREHLEKTKQLSLFE